MYKRRARPMKKYDNLAKKKMVKWQIKRVEWKNKIYCADIKNRNLLWNERQENPHMKHYILLCVHGASDWRTNLLFCNWMNLPEWCAASELGLVAVMGDTQNAASIQINMQL